MDKLNPKAVIFDLGSTLIEYPSTIWEDVMVECVAGVREYLLREGYNLPEAGEFHKAFVDLRDEYRKVAEETLVEWTVLQAFRKLLQGLGIAAPDELLDSVFDAYYGALKPYIYIYDDTVECLRRIRSRYGTLGLISNTIFPEKAHRDELIRFDAEPFFDFMVFSSTFGLRKPHPDIFYKAANIAGMATAECVYIGDRYVEDITGPEAVGMPAVLKRSDGREYPDSMPSDMRQVSSLSELTEHFDF
ncbi:MAG: HAD family hydrolase [candidate division Zixibacteria bacterium]|nr:HAD family hydrolase [candidate division Zixibacteria bacterium]